LVDVTRLRGMQLLALVLFVFGKVTGIGAALSLFFADRHIAASFLVLYIVLIIGSVVAALVDRKASGRDDDAQAAA
jgi:hypothetical protein